MLVRALLCALMLASSLVQAAGYQLVTGDDVNVRQGPSLTAKVVTQVSQGQLVMENGRKGSWSLVSFQTSAQQTVEGWIFNRFLQPRRYSPQATLQPETFTITVEPELLICPESIAISAGAVCYQDVFFHVTTTEPNVRDVRVTCFMQLPEWQNATGDPLSASASEVFHVLSGEAEGMLRLKVALAKSVYPEADSQPKVQCAAR